MRLQVVEPALGREAGCPEGVPEGQGKEVLAASSGACGCVAKGCEARSAHEVALPRPPGLGLYALRRCHC